MASTERTDVFPPLAILVCCFWSGQCVCMYVVFLFLSFVYINHASYFPCRISVSWRLLAENKLSKSTERLVFFRGCPNSLFFLPFIRVLFLSWRRGEFGTFFCVNQSHRFRPASTKERIRKKNKGKNSFSALQPALSSEVSYVAMVWWSLLYCDDYIIVISCESTPAQFKLSFSSLLSLPFDLLRKAALIHISFFFLFFFFLSPFFLVLHHRPLRWFALA